MSGEEQGLIAMMMAMTGVLMVMGLGLYVFLSLALMSIANKTGTENAWFAWIPVLNIILMLQIAKKPVWWIILLLIPLVNIIIAFIIWMAIAEARNKPAWWGIVIMLVPVVNLILIGMLAWTE